MQNIIDLQELQILAQLMDNMTIVVEKLEKAYEKNNGEDFNKSKKEIFDIQNKILNILR